MIAEPEIVPVRAGDANVPILNVTEVVAFERRLAKDGISLLELMKRAGRALAATVEARTETDARVIVLAGSGNNGGDGWVAAQLLADTGHAVTLVAKSLPDSLTAEPARTAALQAASADSFDIVIEPDPVELEALLRNADTIIDAILGTGFAHTRVRSPYDQWIRAANEARECDGTDIIAADCPSGLNAQTGTAADDCICANATVTMLAAKTGLLMPQAQPFLGALLLAPLVPLDRIARMRIGV